jgi:hypothetical protein
VLIAVIAAQFTAGVKEQKHGRILKAGVIETKDDHWCTDKVLATQL